jgi:hypothetical protein
VPRSVRRLSWRRRDESHGAAIGPLPRFPRRQLERRRGELSLHVPPLRPCRRPRHLPRLPLRSRALALVPCISHNFG